jgi:hypothetical protein
MRPDRPGKAWVWSKKRKRWVRPRKPNNASMSYEWDDTRGWVGSSQADVAESWGLALSVIEADTSLKDLFNRAWTALKGGQEWSEAKFNVELKKTSWYQGRSANEQEWFLLENDPARKTELTARVGEAKSGIAALAEQMGATLSDADLEKLSVESLKSKWSDSQIRSAVSAYVGYQTDPATGIRSLFGEAGASEDTIRDYAAKMGVDVSDDMVLKAAQEASATGGGVDKTRDWLRARAKEKYTAWADDLNDPNTTIEDLSYNYRSTMANMLEMSIDEVDMNNPLIQQAMMVGDGTGNKLSIYDFQKQLRLDPRWSQTSSAKEQTAGVVNNVLSTFGLI